MNTKLKHVLANLLVVLLVLEPFSFALAGGITVAPGAPASKQPTMDAAPNGVTVINIVKPGASGLSHNQFDQFNVPAQGVIINNSNRAGVSQLGGAIAGNANFGGGAEARVILNEVTGSSRSRIEGYTEIFGYAAQYILANPNGISVNGGGFINTPKATLTTGAPRFDGAGGLLGLDVRRGDVLIEGQGINAGNIDAFEIISRTAKINAEIHAKNLSIIAGQGSYDPATGQSAPLAPDGSPAPTVVLDSTALGGMYAQRIKFVGTEAGLGVNLGGIVRATDQLTLTADGKIQIAAAVSSDKDATVTSRSNSVEISGKLGAGGTAGVEAAQELRLASQTGGDAPLLYGSTVNISAGKLTNVDGKVLAEKTLSATTTGDVTNAATLQSGGVLSLRSGARVANTGTITATDTLTAEATGTLDNSGTLYSDGTGSFKAGTLNNRAGARIETLGDALFGTNAGFTNAGTINAGGKVTMGAAGLLRNEATGQMLAQTGIGLQALADFDNLGLLSSGGTSAYSVAGQLRNSGTISHSGSASLTLPSLANDATGQILFGGDSLVSVSGDLTNAGLIYSGGKATYRVGGTLLNNRGQLLSQGDMLLEGLTPGSRMTKLQNDSGSIESLTGGLSFRAQTMVNNNLDFSLEEGAIAGTTLEGGLHTFGNDVWGVNPIFSWATGHGYSGAFAWNASRIYPAYVSALGLDTARNVFSLAELTAAVAKAEQELATTPDASRQTLVNWVKSSIIAPQSPYAVMILSGQRGEIAVYEATTATDRAAGMDKGASIAANTSIAIDAGDFRNNVSKVSTASGDITIEAATFENVGRTLYERSTVKWGRGFTNNSKNKGVYSEGTGQELLLTPVGYAYGTINAGGKVSLAAGQVRNGVSENLGVAGTGSAVGIVSPSKPGPLGQNVPSVTDIIGSLPATGLFSVNTTPGHHYLVETNPALTNMSTFYGSDYFLSRSGLDLDKLNMQLLGDAFYETKLVREQILALTGQRLLSSSVTSDAEQMQALMDSALHAQTSLNLTVGVALSEAQISKLTEDIVWLEKTVVAGREVLVPKVYLASASVEKIAQGGSVIVGKDVAITTTGDTSNAGVIQAANTLTITAANVFNTSGALQGQNVTLAATDSIANTSGSISGNDVTLSAGKNITVDTGTVTFASANTTSVVAGRRGSVAASGALGMTAGENIAVTGADVSAGGAASLTAGKTVSIAAQQTSTSSNTSGSGYRASNSLEGNRSATLTSGGALAVTAGEDLLVHGSTVRAGGDATLAAGGNLSIISAANTEDFSRSISSKGSGLFGGKSSEAASGSSSTNVASQVSAGGTLTAEAGKAGTGDLVVSGSKLASGNAMQLKAADDVLVASAQEESSGSFSSSSSGLLNSKSKQQTSYSLTQVGSELTSGSTLAIEGNKGVTVSASTVQGEGDVSLKSSAGDVRVLAAQNASSSSSSEKKSGIGLFVGNGRIDVAQFKEASSKASESGNVGSTVASNHDVTVQASNDASVVGSTVAASNDVTITAGRDVNIVPGRNAKQSQTVSKESGIGIGYSLSENQVGVSIGFKSTEKGENSSGQYNAKSLVSAGNDVNIQAGRNVNQISSDIKAGQDIKTTAGQDVNVTAAKDVEHLDQYVKETEAGVSLAVRQSVSTAVRTVAELPQTATAGKGSDAAKAVTAASAGVKAVSSVTQAMNSSASASLTAGISVSENRSSSDSATSVASTISAGSNVEQTAGRDLALAGAQVQGGKDVTLTAGRDAAITAAQNQYSSSKNSSYASASVGVGASVGVNGSSAGYQLSASLAGSKGESQAQTNTNALMSAGETLTVKSGQDTTIAGANLGGKDVKMDIGRDLTVASLQDTASSSSSSYNVGATVTIGPAPGVVKNALPGDPAKVGTTGNSGSFGGGSGSSSSAWVNGQTSVIGTNSVDIRTEKNTHVEGAVIAAENGNLKLDTGTLTYKDISDSDTGSNTQVGVSVPLGSAIGSSASPAKGDSSPVGDFLMGSTLSGSYDSHDREQINRATIGEGTITVRSNPDQDLTGLNRDPKKAQEVTKDSETSAKLYLDPAAIKEVVSGFKETKEYFNKLRELVKKELTAEQKLALAMTLQEISERGLIAKESAAALIAYANLSKDQQIRADANLEKITSLGDSANNPQLTEFIGTLTYDERLNIAYSVTSSKPTAETTRAMLVAILGVEVYNSQSSNITAIDSSSRDTSQFLPRAVVGEINSTIEANVSAIEAHTSEISSALSTYKSADSTELRLAALQNITREIANSLGVGDVKIVAVGEEGGKIIAQVRPMVSTTTITFLGLFTISQSATVSANAIEVPADSPLLQKSATVSKQDIVNAIVHELVHAQQAATVDNYLNGRDKTQLGALLTAGFVAGGIDSNRSLGYYRAMPQEAEAYFVGDSVAQKLKDKGLFND